METLVGGFAGGGVDAFADVVDEVVHFREGEGSGHVMLGTWMTWYVWRCDISGKSSVEIDAGVSR